MTSKQNLVRGNLTATGNNQATALLLDALGEYHICENVPAGSGVLLPRSNNGTKYEITNHTANNLLVYPQPTCTINDGAVNAPITIGAGLTIPLISSDGLNFHVQTDASNNVGPAGSPNNVLVTNASSVVVGGGTFGSGAGVANQFMTTDNNGNLSAALFTCTGVTGTNGNFTNTLSANSATFGAVGCSGAISTGIANGQVVGTTSGGALTGLGTYGVGPGANRFIQTDSGDNAALSGQLTAPYISGTIQIDTKLLQINGNGGVEGASNSHVETGRVTTLGTSYLSGLQSDTQRQTSVWTGGTKVLPITCWVGKFSIAGCNWAVGSESQFQLLWNYGMDPNCLVFLSISCDNNANGLPGPLVPKIGVISGVNNAYYVPFSIMQMGSFPLQNNTVTITYQIIKSNN